MALVYTAWFTALFLVSATFGEHFDIDDFVNSINSMQDTWVAVRSPAAELRFKQMQQFRGIINVTLPSTIEIKEHDEEFIRSLPDSFHPKEKWPNCPSFDEIRDQGACNCCWAFAAVEVMTDRYCTYGNKHVHISAEDLLTCCGNKTCGNCDGGLTDRPWLYWNQYGLVTGGNYESNEGCRPYTIKNCSHTSNGSLPSCKSENTPSCIAECREGYDKTYNQDKRYANNIYALYKVENIMAEIYKNGPVQTQFFLYDDFFFYKSGVYRHVKGEQRGLHAVKVLGWGVENGTKYWLIANSWNVEWGDGGFVKFVRGEHNCLIDDLGAYAGEPYVNW